MRIERGCLNGRIDILGSGNYYYFCLMNSLSQKAHDISSAVFRVATLVKNRKLRLELENAAVELVVRYEEVANPALSHSATVIDVLERLVTLAESVKEMKEINAQVLRRELDGFQAAIVLKFSESKRQDVDLSEEFERLSTNSESSTNIRRMEEEGSMGQPTSENVEINVGVLDVPNGRPTSPNGNGKELTDRQTAILFKVREIPFCRLRNLMEVFPDISERTIRNEIAVLIQNALVRRVGLGGPNSYFESMEIATVPEQQVQKI